MIIRRATIEDARNLSALAIQVWLHAHAKQGITSGIAGYVFTELGEENLKRQIKDQDKTILVAYQDKFLVAYAILNLRSTCPDAPMIQTELTTFYVQEHCTHKGIGTGLFAECLKRSINDSGKPALWLAISTKNNPAVDFCRKQGMILLGFSNFELGTERHESYLLASGDL